MQYTTKKCPHCKFAYTVMEAKGGVNYGSPILTCERCGKPFIDKEYREIAVDGPRDSDTKKIYPYTIFICVFTILFSGPVLFLFISYPSLFSQKDDFLLLIVAILLVVWAIYSVIRDVKSYDERQEYLKKERAESEARLSNYQYACFLKEIGYDVPKKYLVPPSPIDSCDTQQDIHYTPISEHHSTDISMEKSPSKQILFCNKCGERLLDNSLFCPYCGNKIFTDNISSDK